MVKKKIENDPRAVKILEMELAGHTTKEIAAELNVDTSTVWRIKRRPTFLGILENNRAKYDRLLDEMSDSDQTTIRIAAMQERGRLDRSGTKILADAELKRMEQGRQGCNEACPYFSKYNEEHAKEQEHIIYEVIQIQPWQMRRLENHFLNRPYEDITQTWKPPPRIGDEFKKTKKIGGGD